LFIAAFSAILRQNAKPNASTGLRHDVRLSAGSLQRRPHCTAGTEIKHIPDAGKLPHCILQPPFQSLLHTAMNGLT